MDLQPLLLAAGYSRRFGAPKLLQPLPDGLPLVVAAARNLEGGAGEVLAVVHPEHESLQTVLSAYGITWLACPDTMLGMGHSLACGVRASADADGWLIALADMPSIQPATIAAVHAALLDGAALAAPVYQGKRGHPVGFGARFRDALLALSGDRGAKSLLQGADLHSIPCDDSGILIDIDTP